MALSSASTAFVAAAPSAQLRASVLPATRSAAAPRSAAAYSNGASSQTVALGAGVALGLGGAIMKKTMRPRVAARAAFNPTRCSVEDGALAGKVALVTGGGSGIGRGIAVQLAKSGAKVVICGRTLPKLQDTVKIIAELGGSCEGIASDISVEKNCSDLVQKIIEDYGHLDILVNNAGIEGPSARPLEECSAEDFDRLFDVNVKGQFLLCKAVIPHMKKRAEALKADCGSFEDLSKKRPHAGCIINLSSIAGEKGFKNLSLYSSTNFARIGLTRSLALELAPHFINVNALCPGIVYTEIWDRLADGMAKESGGEKMAAFKDSVETLIPMKRPQITSEMGDLAVFFATQPNVTGQDVAVDGGYCA